MANKNLTIHFENASAMVIYEWEMSGQISDGKYENSRPHDHWKWVCEISNMIVDGTTGIEGYSLYRQNRFDGTFAKRYNINEWFSKYIKSWRKDGKTDCMWATRIIAFGKFGKIYPDITYDQMMKLNGIDILLDNLQMNIEKGENNPDVLFDNITNFETCSWVEKYYEASKEYFTLDFVKKFVELNYDIKECKVDVKSMEKSINSVF